MQKILFVIALPFTALLDVSVVVALMHFLAVSVFSQELFWWQYIFIAPLIGVFPDFDVFFELFTKKKIDDEHHSLLHYPIFMVTVGFVFGWLLFSPFWGTIIALAWLAHYLHDSSMVDFGIKWLWPLSRNQYHFLGKKRSDNRFRFVLRYTPQELKKLKDQFVDLTKWLEMEYYHPSRYFLIELAISTTLLSLVSASYFEHLLAIIPMTFILWTPAAAIWLFSRSR